MLKLFLPYKLRELKDIIFINTIKNPKPVQIAFTTMRISEQWMFWLTNIIYILSYKVPHITNFGQAQEPT